ncbi:MAG: hypothetical protein AAF704_13185 [Cyanobacteria bacterium P01_D01_bin.123]
MKLNIAILSAIAAGTLGFVPAALAGEGGIAGAASFILNGESVTEASVAAAIGKDTAYAGALTDPTLGGFSGSGSTQAFAIGTGGSIGFTGIDIFISDVSQDTNRATAQTNELTDQTINISAFGGDLNLGDTGVDALVGP